MVSARRGEKIGVSGSSYWKLFIWIFVKIYIVTFEVVPRESIHLTQRRFHYAKHCCMVFKTGTSCCAIPFWDISRTILLKCDRNSRMANEMWNWSLCGGESFIFILKLNYYRQKKNKISTRITMFIGMMDFRIQRFNFF